MTQNDGDAAGAGGVGTVQYMAPELFKLKPLYATASDVYALGMVAWELASGEVPYDGVNKFAIPIAVKNGERSEMPSETPAEFAAAIEQCWAQEATKRPSAAAAFKLFRALQADNQQSSDTPSKTRAKDMRMPSEHPMMRVDSNW